MTEESKAAFEEMQKSAHEVLDKSKRFILISVLSDNEQEGECQVVMGNLSSEKIISLLKTVFDLELKKIVDKTIADFKITTVDA